jgi:NADPH:quinone reductase-like Zn-dependent oxidoreductase
MKALVLKKFGKPENALEIREITRPVPNENEVLVRVEASGLNYADIMAVNGFYRDAPPVPCVLGYEIVGRVEAAGKNVDASWIGKRVLSLVRFGGMAEYAIAKDQALMEIPGEMDPAHAAALATQYVTAMHAAYDLANLQGDELIAVHAAAGGVGTAIIQLAKLKGCRVIAMTGSDEKFSYLRELNVDNIINYRKTDYVSEIEKIAGKKSINVFFNSVGGSTFRKDRKLLSGGGKSVLYGVAERSDGKFGIFSTIGLLLRMGRIVPVFLMMRSQSVMGVNMLTLGDERPAVLQRAFQGVMKLVEEGKIAPRKGGEFRYTEAAKAFDLLASRKSTGKIIIKWN